VPAGGAPAEAEPTGAAPPSAAAASCSEGIWIVLPATTWASSGRPFAAASERVVKLLAAAIENSVSPGCTVCGTLAAAGAANDSNTKATSGVRRERPMGTPSLPWKDLHSPVFPYIGTPATTWTNVPCRMPASASAGSRCGRC
jgi:hypothetical protein